MLGRRPSGSAARDRLTSPSRPQRRDRPRPPELPNSLVPQVRRVPKRCRVCKSVSGVVLYRQAGGCLADALSAGSLGLDAPRNSLLKCGSAIAWRTLEHAHIHLNSHAPLSSACLPCRQGRVMSCRLAQPSVSVAWRELTSPDVPRLRVAPRLRSADSRLHPACPKHGTGGHALGVLGNHDMKLVRKPRGKDVQITHGLAETLAEIEGLSDDIADRFSKDIADSLDSLASHYMLGDSKLIVAYAGMKAEMQAEARARSASSPCTGRRPARPTNSACRSATTWRRSIADLPWLSTGIRRFLRPSG